MAIKPLDWSTVVGQRIRIYRNLNNGTMSVQIHTPGVGWRVAGNTTNAIVSGVSFEVSEAGRRRVIRDRCKNVHAWGQGVLLGEFDTGVSAPIDLDYDPYIHEAFVERHSNRVLSNCSFLVVRDNKVWVSADALGVTLKKAEPRGLFEGLAFNQWQFCRAA